MSDQLVLRSHELVERNQRLLTETRVYIALSSDGDEGAHLSASCDVSRLRAAATCYQIVVSRLLAAE